VPADTLDKLVHDLTTLTPDKWQPWMTTINNTSLVIVDEAGLASTPKLDTAIGFVLGRGGRVLLVGDDRQRAASGAGGVLRDIETSHGAVTLSEVLRFTDPTEGQASLALRAGDPSAVGFYADRSRVHAVTTDTAADLVYQGWAADIANGVDSVMIAPTLEMVADLNARARTDRITNNGGVTGPELVLPNGERVSAGDTVITKRNKRTLSMGGTDFVRNNYRWTVQQVNADGSLLATEITRGVTRVLPAWYVTAGFLRLGYAYTHASVQGMTVGTAHTRKGTAHTVVTDRMTRQDLYPTLTRATDGTHAYVILGGEGDPHEVITPDALQPPTAIEVLTGVIGRDGAARSATTEIRDAQDPGLRVGHAAAAYVHALTVGAITILGKDRIDAITAGAEQAVPGITTAPAWETLLGHLAVLALDGYDPVARLVDAAAERELDTAMDLAAVLDYRLDPTGNHSQRSGPLPWVPDIPEILTETPVWATYLAARSQLITDLITELTGKIRGWTRLDAPSWAVPYLLHRDLLVDLAVWRAANNVNAEDLRPAGDRPRRIALRRYHDDLVERCLTVAGGRDDGADRWLEVLAEHGADVDTITEDEFWPVLVGRLNLAETAGLPVRNLLGTAARRGPLPVEQTAAALWWRLVPHLGAVTTNEAAGQGTRLRPTWTEVLTEHLGERVAERIVTDRLWPTLVARVDAAVRAGHDPARLVADAAGMFAATLDTVPEHQWATVLLWHLAILTDPAPVEDEDASHPDPADADRQPPTDLHTQSAPTTAEPTVADDHQAGDENLIATGDLEAPAEADQVPPDPDNADAAGEDADPAVDENRVLAALSAAAAFYAAEGPRSWVPAYLTGRGLPATAAGYAPATWTALVNHLRQAGYTDQEILAAGLARHSSKGGLIDFFRNRAVLPITRPQDGAVVAFIGRKHPDDTNDRAPKYLNSPTTTVFRKSDLPFGLTPRQGDLLREGADLVIVEGPMDALAVTVARPDLVAVAPLGTALTPGHLTTLDRIAPLTDRRVQLLLDDDKAGRAASVRAWRTLVDAGVNDAHAITLEGAKDPAELLANRGPDALAEALDRRHPLADLVVDEITHRWTDGNDFVEHRINALREAAHLIGTMPPAQQTRQASRLAEQLDLDYLTVIDAILDNTPPDPDAVAPAPTDPLGLPRRPILSTDPQPEADPGHDRSEVAGRWRNEQAREARTNSAAALLVDAWADRPDLAQRVANAEAMADIADRINQLQQDSIDVRQMLADLPVADLEVVDDPAAYAADLLDPAELGVQDVDQQDLSRVADLITQTWRDVPDLARQVIEDPWFPSTVRAVTAAENQGLAISDLLADVPRHTVAALREKARFAAHAIRVAAADRARPEPEAEPHPTDNPTWHLDGAADVLRGAWREHPDVAEKLITGPGFDVLADRMAHAQQAGLDAGALLETIDPDKIAAADVPSPAGITAAALSRAVADAQIPAWTEREYGHFTDETLTGELAHARQRLDAAAAEQRAAARDAARLAEEAAAGQGPAVTRLEQELAELHRTAQELARHRALEADWRTAIQTAQAAAAAAAVAEHERNQLRGRARGRRAELDARIAELHRQEAEAHEAAAAAAEVASTLDRVPKDPAERQRVAERISGADVLHLRQREAALTKDIESAERITLRVAAAPDRSAVDRLEAELRARTELSPHRHRQETLERDAQLAAPAHSHEIGRAPGVEYQITNSQPASVDPPLPSPSIQPGI
jgi:DNA primase catalytic core